MKQFTELYFALDRTRRTSEKVELLVNYFRQAPRADAAWAVYLLSGKKLDRRISYKSMRQWAADATGLPLWLVEECHAFVGDLSETLALLTGTGQPVQRTPSLHEVMEQVLLPLSRMTSEQQHQALKDIWANLKTEEKLVFHKLLGGNFRIGVSKQLLVRALAEVAQVEPAVISHRLAGHWSADEPSLARLLDSQIGQSSADSTLPYPFMLAQALHEPIETLGDIADWLIEWKWDGIRAQIVRRQGKIALWSRGDEMIADAFPEIIHAAVDLPDNTVLDGELLAWHPGEEHPRLFNELQTRLNRKVYDLSFWPEVPVRFIAFDLLEHAGVDLKSQPLRTRREALTQCVAALPNDGTIGISPQCQIGRWDDLSEMMKSSRQRQVEGTMLKRLDTTYQPGRHAGLWWKLKVAPYTVDAVLIAAEPGHGRRAGLLTDYTFAVWDNDQLVTLAKAYSGLTDEELTRIDRHCRKNTIRRFGPVHTVEPTMVFELGFEAIAKSTRHKSGLALRFPRILRIRDDKLPKDADTLSRVAELLKNPEAR